MRKRVIFTITIASTLFSYARFDYINVPFFKEHSKLDSLPLGVDMVTQNVNIDDLPIAKDAQKEYEPYLGDIPLENRLKVDINCDGKKEIIVWKKFAHDNRGNYYQLMIFDFGGTLLWEGPKEKNINNRLIFGDWDIGTSFPQVLADVDGDCQLELLAPIASSELSPQYFKRLKWDKDMMVALEDAILMHSKSNSKEYIWVENYKGNGLNTGWVMNLYPTKHINEAEADTVYMDRYGNATFNKVLLEFNPKGASVKRVIKKGSI